MLREDVTVIQDWYLPPPPPPHLAKSPFRYGPLYMHINGN